MLLLLILLILNYFIVKYTVVYIFFRPIKAKKIQNLFNYRNNKNKKK